MNTETNLNTQLLKSCLPAAGVIFVILFLLMADPDEASGIVKFGLDALQLASDAILFLITPALYAAITITLPLKAYKKTSLPFAAKVFCVTTAAIAFLKLTIPNIDAAFPFIFTMSVAVYMLLRFDTINNKDTGKSGFQVLLGVPAIILTWLGLEAMGSTINAVNSIPQHHLIPNTNHAYRLEDATVIMVVAALGAMWLSVTLNDTSQGENPLYKNKPLSRTAENLAQHFKLLIIPTAITGFVAFFYVFDGLAKYYRAGYAFEGGDVYLFDSEAFIAALIAVHSFIICACVKIQREVVRLAKKELKAKTSATNQKTTQDDTTTLIAVCEHVLNDVHDSTGVDNNNNSGVKSSPQDESSDTNDTSSSPSPSDP